jgi:RNA ligase (TIGR02306 family)
MLAEIELIKEVTTHSNADRLDIVKVKGFPAIVSRGAFKVGDKVLFIYPDTVLPESPWAEFYKKFNKKRVKAQKLRGIWSFGIVVSLEDVGLDDSFNVGDDVSSLGITKYIAPVSQVYGGVGGLPVNLPKTDEIMFQNIDISKYFGKKVDVTLKIDGSSWTAYCIRDENEPDGFRFGITGRSVDFDVDKENIYTVHNKVYDVENVLKSFCIENDVSLAIRGEVYGQGLQNSSNNPHSKLKIDLALYSVFNFDEMKYERTESKYYIFEVAKSLNMKTVPMIEKGVEFNQELIDRYLTPKKLNGQSFEGVVINTEEDSFKIINMDYDSRK